MDSIKLKEIAKNLVNEYAKHQLQSGYIFTGLHLYYDEYGKLIYFKTRLKHPDGKKWIRPFHYNSMKSNWTLGEPKFNSTKPLYSLLGLKNNDQLSDVWVVEGEQKVDTLIKLGFVATTSGSSSSASSVDWKPLRNRSIIIWPDFDDAGSKYMQEVMTILQSLNCSIRCIDVVKLKLPSKGDVIDWLNIHPKATQADILALPIVSNDTYHNINDENTSNQQRTEVELIRANYIKPEPISWLWSGWLAAGKMHIFGGSAGTGKTTISIALAATVSRGGQWPDTSRCIAGNVVIWSGEDDPKDTLTPRLIQSGADLSRVYFVSGVVGSDVKRSFDPAKDMELLGNKLEEVGDVHLVIIDPIVSAISGDSHKNAEFRRGLQPLVDLAVSMRFALLGITHFTKGTSGCEPIERITGSLAFGALARIVLVATKQQNKDSGDTRLFLRAKSNIGPDSGGFKYELQNAELDAYPGVFTSAVAWGESVVGSARELLTNAETFEVNAKESALSEAMTFLLKILSYGPMPMRTVQDQASGNGYSWATIKRAKRSLDVRSYKEAGNIGEKGKGWFWKLPETNTFKYEDLEEKPLKMLINTEVAQQNNVSTFIEFEHLLENSDI